MPPKKSASQSAPAPDQPETSAPYIQQGVLSSAIEKFRQTQVENLRGDVKTSVEETLRTIADRRITYQDLVDIIDDGRSKKELTKVEQAARTALYGLLNIVNAELLNPEAPQDTSPVTAGTPDEARQTPPVTAVIPDEPPQTPADQPAGRELPSLEEDLGSRGYNATLHHNLWPRIKVILKKAGKDEKEWQEVYRYVRGSIRKRAAYKTKFDEVHRVFNRVLGDGPEYTEVSALLDQFLQACDEIDPAKVEKEEKVKKVVPTQEVQSPAPKKMEAAPQPAQRPRPPRRQTTLIPEIVPVRRSPSDRPVETVQPTERETDPIKKQVQGYLNYLSELRIDLDASYGIRGCDKRVRLMKDESSLRKYFEEGGAFPRSPRLITVDGNGFKIYARQELYKI